MFYYRPADERGHTKTDWLDSYHSFSFGQYFDPGFMGFSSLRVINDDVVAPGKGFGTHPHDNMEIISVILSGKLEHKDSLGNGSVISAGEIQKMTAGKGVTHSEFNPSPKDPVHFLQIWIIPNVQDLEPGYEQRKFSAAKTRNKLGLIVSPDAKDGSVQIHQDAYIYRSLLENGKKVSYDVTIDRAIWIQMTGGSADVNGTRLEEGDGLAVFAEKNKLEITGIDDTASFLLFDLQQPTRA